MYHETFTNRRELAENLADHLEGQSDEMSVFVDLTAQEIGVHIPVSYTGISDEEYAGHEVVYVERIGSHEAFGVMEDFARSRTDEQARPLLKALSRSHPFKGFRYALEDTNQLEDWYAFKNETYVDLAEACLESYGIDVVDGKIVCSDKDAISIYEPEQEPEFDDDDDDDDE